MRIRVPFIILDPSWGVSVPERCEASPEVLAFLCVCLGAVLILFAIREIKRVSEMRRRAAA